MGDRLRISPGDLRIRSATLCLLLAGVVLTASCGLVRAPFRIVGGLTRATVEAGRKAKAKAQAKSERRKLEKEAKEAKQEAEDAATMDGGVLPPLQDGIDGEAPELILEPLPPPEEATLPALPQ
jgi:hypothetical protein